jgi:GT2 family glycosyltransferase
MLSIIIVNYKSAALVLDCLHSLYGGGGGEYPFEVLVVDNASGDDSQQRVTSVFPQVIWIPVNYNAGFARANNEGIRRSAGDAVLLLNGDTLPHPSTITQAYHRLMDSSFIAAGIQLLNPDGTPQISGMYVMKGGLNYLLPLPYLGTLIKKAGQMAKVKKPHVAGVGETGSDMPGGFMPGTSQDGSLATGSSDRTAIPPSPIDVDWINGAFLMVKKNAIEKAGLLDEDFFLYAEEAEWCSRLKRTGPLCLFGDLNMVHLQGETANQEFGSTGKGYYNLYDRKGLQIMLSNFVRIRKQFGVGWFLIQLLFYLIGIPFFLLGVICSRLFSKTPRYSFSQFLRYSKNVAVIVRLSPVIIRNKPYFYKVL